MDDADVVARGVEPVRDLRACRHEDQLPYPRRVPDQGADAVLEQVHVVAIAVGIEVVGAAGTTTTGDGW